MSHEASRQARQTAMATIDVPHPSPRRRRSPYSCHRQCATGRGRCPDPRNRRAPPAGRGPASSFAIAGCPARSRWQAQSGQACCRAAHCARPGQGSFHGSAICGCRRCHSPSDAGCRQAGPPACRSRCDGSPAPHRRAPGESQPPGETGRTGRHDGHGGREATCRYQASL